MTRRRPPDPKALGAYFADRRDERGMKNAELARLSGLSGSYLPQLFRGTRSDGRPLAVSRPTVIALTMALRLTREEAAEAAVLGGFLDDPADLLVWEAHTNPGALTSGELRQAIARAHELLAERAQRDSRRQRAARERAEPGEGNSA